MAKEFDILQKVLLGETSEASIKRTRDILKKQGINPEVTIEFISREGGVFCGIGEVTQLLTRNLPEAFRDDVWALNDGDVFQKNEVLLRITSTYAIISQFITAINGFISSGSTVELKRLKGTPLLSTRNLVKFHLILSFNLPFSSDFRY